MPHEKKTRATLRTTKGITSQVCHPATPLYTLSHARGGETVLNTLTLR